LIVGKSEATNLNWLSSGGTKVVISGFATGSGQKEFQLFLMNVKIFQLIH